MPGFREGVRGIPRSEATVNFGTIVVVTGFVGTFVGGWMGDYFAKNSQQAYLWLSAVVPPLPAPLSLLALTSNPSTMVLGYNGTAPPSFLLPIWPLHLPSLNPVLD